MLPMEDTALLQEYARTASEPAFPVPAFIFFCKRSPPVNGLAGDEVTSRLGQHSLRRPCNQIRALLEIWMDFFRY